MDCACVCVRACVTARARDSFFCCLIVDNLKIHTHTHTHTLTHTDTHKEQQPSQLESRYRRIAKDEMTKQKNPFSRRSMQTCVKLGNTWTES